MVYDRNTENAIQKYSEKLQRKSTELSNHQNRTPLTKLRNSWIAKQKSHNSNTEYERLIGVLSNKVITHTADVSQLNSRIKTLEHLGARAVTGIDPTKKQSYEDIKNELKIYNKKKNQSS